METESAEGTVLFVSPGPDVATPISGEGTRLHHLSEQLHQRGWDIIILVPKSTDQATPNWVRRAYTYRQWSLPFLTDCNPRFVSALARILRQEAVDVIHLSHGVCAAQGISKLLGADALVNYASQNVEADHARDFVDPDLPIYKRVLGPRLIPIIERMTVRCADTITTVSEADRTLFMDRYGVADSRVRSVPTGTTTVDTSELEDRETIRAEYGLNAESVAVFHGSYSHPPNAEAVDLLTNRVLPAVREQGVDLELLLVGAGMPAIDSSAVTTTGFVEDLFSTLNAADFAIVPIVHGGGTKTKVFDYLSLGLPLVSTAKGVHGIDVSEGVHGIVTEGVDEEFISGVVQLGTDDTLRRDYSRNIREWARQRTWARSGERMASFYLDWI